MCMSQRPGIRNFLEASITRVSAGTLTFAAGPNPVIRPPEIITVISSCGGEPVASITATGVRASGTLSAWDALTRRVCATTTPHATINQTEVQRKSRFIWKPDYEALFATTPRINANSGPWGPRVGAGAP